MCMDTSINRHIDMSDFWYVSMDLCRYDWVIMSEEKVPVMVEMSVRKVYTRVGVHEISKLISPCLFLFELL